MRRRRFRHTFNDGSTWTFVVQPMENDLGHCSEDTKQIRLNNRQTGAELLDTIVHELTHRAFPTVGEARVAQFANDVTEVLERFGYRRRKQ